MRMLSSCLFLLAATLGNAKAGDASAEKDAFYWNARIGRGVNLGNALEAPEEGAWGVRLEASYFKRIAEAGFNSVRIPARWSSHAGETAPYSIDPTFFERVDWAVNQALSNDLAVVLNIHHYREMETEPEAHRDRFLGLWRQIAEHYRDYPEELCLELLNEPCKKLTNALWNDYAARAVRLIRESNRTRILVIGPTQWNNINELKNLRLPEDDKRIIVTFHYYLPFHFTHQGAGWVGEQSRDWLGTRWTGSDEERGEVAGHFDEVAAWAKARGVPLYMGEFGAYEKADMTSRATWTAHVRQEAEKRGFSWAYWEFCAGFGVYDSEKQAWREPLRKALVP